MFELFFIGIATLLVMIVIRKIEGNREPYGLSRRDASSSDGFTATAGAIANDPETHHHCVLEAEASPSFDSSSSDSSSSSDGGASSSSSDGGGGSD
jgi:uncharacterized membrane protein YgcG